MKIKIDENLPLDLASLLISFGHDVESVFSQGLAGKSDDVIYSAVQSESRLLFTSDLDFSDIRKYPLGSHPGIVLIRLTDERKTNVLRIVRNILTNYDLLSFSNSLVIISEHKIRIKRNGHYHK